MGELTILLTAGAMMTTGPYKAFKLTEAALGKGHRVNLFCYGEGVTALNKEQAPKEFPDLTLMVQRLMAKGLNVAACRSCSVARGLDAGDLVDGTVFGSIAGDYIRFASRSDRIIHIAF